MFESVNPGWSTPPWGEFGAARPFGGGWRHQGIDYYVPRGTPVFASGDGEVAGAGYDPSGYGFFIDVRYADYIVRVAHNEERATLPRGARTTAYTVIGSAGDTGNAQGITWNGLVHPHVEVRKLGSGTLQNPRVVLRPFDRTQMAGSEVTPIVPPTPEELEQDMIWLKHDSHEVWFLIAPGVATQRIRDHQEARLISQVLMKGQSAPRATSAQLTALIARCEASLPERVGLDSAELARAVAAEVRAEIAAVPRSVVDELRNRL